MNIALIGYGKMGKAIESVALAKGHNIVLKIDINNSHELTAQNLKRASVAIEFTTPGNAFNNITRCFDAGTPVVSGTTGWQERLNEIKQICQEKNATFLSSSNFSIGVNIFFEMNKYLASLMAAQPDYDVTMEEIHHTQKLDSPSGTAITLAEQILEKIKWKHKWINDNSSAREDLEIISERIDLVPGTHKVKYTSAVDDIELIHTAHNREGFAKGAVLAAEFIEGRKGIFTMSDVLGF